MPGSTSGESFSSSLPASKMNKAGLTHVSQKFTFGKQGCREIAMQNMRLAGRLDEIKRRPKPKAPSTVSPLASSAINRKKRDFEIDRKNMVLSRRLNEAKSVLTPGQKKDC
ncbi:hypothetical protein GE061_007444 [Apolygus lucorum]|uniref:Uncharacterized protein n=1 Tax=Apolygus lucorum TaxID=248454 RepID=A0A6A4ITE3_APOLU|nr:hypothetical protein GE061_007444 [Apolygus lucorum]